MKYGFANETFGMNQARGKPLEYDLESSFKFLRTQGRRWKLPPPAKCYGFPAPGAGLLPECGLSF